MWGRDFDWYLFWPTWSTLTPKYGANWGFITWHWNCGQYALRSNIGQKLQMHQKNIQWIRIKVCWLNDWRPHRRPKSHNLWVFLFKVVLNPNFAVRHIFVTVTLFLGGVLPYCHRVRRPASSLSLFVTKSYISRTAWRRITQFYINLHTRRVYKQTGYDATIYFRLEVIDVRRGSKMTHPTALLLYISWTLWVKITQFYRHVHFCTGYDIYN